MPTTNGISPKLVVTIVTFVLTLLATRYAITVPDGLDIAIATIIAGRLGWQAPAGDIVAVDPGPPSDEQLGGEYPRE